VLIITGGDVLGTNAEAIAKILPKSTAVATIVVGSRWHFENQCSHLGLTLPDFKSVSDVNSSKDAEYYFLDIHENSHQKKSADQISILERGQLALKALNICKTIKAQNFAVLTGPIDKSACAAAGFSFGGQTEFFENLWEHPACMILAGPKLRVGLATNHLPLRAVADHISKEGIIKKINLFNKALKLNFGIENPRIAVCGLNPHAGDNGLFGDEDTKLILPAVEEAQNSGINAQGPVPADTAFYRCYQGHFDGVLAMYHDQGLAPLKTVHFDTAVNISGGLPHLRLSPDHGPVKDLFMQNKVSTKSWEAAYNIAIHSIQNYSEKLASEGLQ